ncbi:hypothetical protein ACHAWF_007279 [Thalassiosira exigua]
MSRPPLYSRTDISPLNAGGSESKMVIGSSRPNVIAQDCGIAGKNQAPGSSLLEMAQKFSMFAVEHVEEVRQVLAQTAGNSLTSEGAAYCKNSTEIAEAFAELTAAYNKLSSLKWDAARVQFEETHRAKASLEAKHSKIKLGSKSNDQAGNHTAMLTETREEKVIIESRQVKEDPWQDEINPHDWIADAFLKSSMTSEEEEEGGDSFPVNGRLASLNAISEPFPKAVKAASTPPGFKSESAPSLAAQETDKEVTDSSVPTKPAMRSLTSMSSEISSLHTTSIPYTDYEDESADDDDDDDAVDSESEYSDASSSSEEELPSMANFDYLYKGGFAMKVSGGKEETKGVVPKSVKRVLVDRSVKSIEEGAFQGCIMLESITIPSTVESIGDHAFRKCSKLMNVNFLTRAPKSRGRKLMLDQKRDEKKEENQSHRSSPLARSSVSRPRSSGLRSIGDWAFFNCSSLSEMKLPHGLESIGTRAFQRCSSLSILELPTTLTRVEESAFIGCPRETKVAFESWEKRP